MTIFVEGLGEVQIVNNEYTHPDVGREYKRQIAVLTDIFARRPSVTGTDASTSFSAADHDAIVNAIKALRNLAQNGLERNVVLGNPNSPTERFFLTTEMANNLDLVLRSLKIAGITTPPAALNGVDKKNAVINWIDLAGFGVAEILQSAVSAGINNRSIQSLLELEYVKTGNDVIFTALTNLEEALGITKEVLETLEQVQALRNQVALQSLPTLSAFLEENFPQLLPQGSGLPVVDGDLWVTQYSAALADYVKLVVPSYTGDPNQLAFSIFDLRAKLNSQLLRLEQVSPENTRSVEGTLAFNINEIIKAISLVFTSRTIVSGGTSLVFHDINSPPSALRRAAINFLLVNTGEEQLLSATFQSLREELNADFNLENSISTAITSAESLNDTQKQDVRRFLFVFEEFYKSASAVLTKMSQIIDKFAQNIAR